MGRPKGSKNKTASKNDPNVEDTYETTVEFMCPIRGLVKQKVKVKKLKPMSSSGHTQMIGNEDALADIEKEDDGLTIYDESDEVE